MDQHSIRTAMDVAREPADVYRFMATAAHWPKIWPLTLRVEGTTDRPLAVGEQCVEHVKVGAWRGRFHWTAEAADPPSHYVLTGTAVTEGMPSAITALLQTIPCRIEYTLAASGGTTHFERLMTYPIVGWQGHLANALGFGERIDRIIAEALVAAKAWLENPLLDQPEPNLFDQVWLTAGDPLADAAIRSLIPASGDLVPLERFIASLYRADPSAPVSESLTRYLTASTTVPAWTCQPRVQLAEQVFLDWGTLVFASLVCAGLPETYTLPHLSWVLDQTAQLDMDAMHVRRRLDFTLRMVFDMMRPGALAPGGSALEATRRVRLIHALVRTLLPLDFASTSRLAPLVSIDWRDTSRVPINQLELLYTLMTFSHVVLRSLETFGCNLTPYEEESYVHTWNVIGAGLGIRDELLPHDRAHAARIFQTIKSEYSARSDAGVRLAARLVPYWDSNLRAVPNRLGTQLMAHVMSELLDGPTLRMLGLDTLPALPGPLDSMIRHLEDGIARLLGGVFGDLTGVGRAAAALVAESAQAATQTEETQSGLGDLVQQLASRRAASG